MSGLLRKLAAQALGQAPNLRPAAWLRRDADVAAAGDPLQEGMADLPTREVDAGLRGTASSPEDTARPFAAQDEPTSVAARPFAAPAPSPGNPRDDADRSNAERRLHAAAAPETPAWLAADPARDVQRPGGDEAEVFSRRVPNIAGRAMAAAAMTEGSAARAVSAGRPERAVSRVPMAVAREQQPDVHIHIGRIELTAIGSSQPARRDRPAPPKSSSLDDYLQRRGGGKP